MVDAGEDCDVSLGGQSCVGQGYDSGALHCNADCTFDLSACTMANCGDGTINGKEVCDGTELGAATCMTEGFDVGLEMSGAEAAFNQMLDAMNHGGRIAVLGIPAGPMTLDVNDVIFKGLEIQGIYGRRIFETWYKMAAMLQSGLEVADVITHRIDAVDFDEAFVIVETGECGKVILNWV